MIREIVEQWDARKDELAKWLATSHPESYEHLVTKLVELVINERVQYDCLDPKRIHVINDGSYQGTEIYLIATDDYQPGADDYIWFDNEYGSCSGCDTLQAISGYSGDLPTPDQVKQYMTLALHMVQRMAWLEDRRADKEAKEREELIVELTSENARLQTRIRELEVEQALDEV